MNSQFRSRAVNIEKIVNVIRGRVVQRRDLDGAVSELLEVLHGSSTWHAQFLDRLTDVEKAGLRTHTKRYLAMYLHDAGFDLIQTFQFGNPSTGKHEAALVSTRSWKPGEYISLATGSIALLNKEEEKEINMGKDFSVMISSRYRCACLFLGPARFVNHDCQSTCQVVRPIERGDEITVFYGANYFGINNVNCRCRSCTQKAQEQEEEEELLDELSKADTTQGSIGRHLRKRRRVVRPISDVFSKLSPGCTTFAFSESSDDSYISYSSEDGENQPPPAQEENLPPQPVKKAGKKAKPPVSKSVSVSNPAPELKPPVPDSNDVSVSNSAPESNPAPELNPVPESAPASELKPASVSNLESTIVSVTNPVPESNPASELNSVPDSNSVPVSNPVSESTSVAPTVSEASEPVVATEVNPVNNESSTSTENVTNENPSQPPDQTVTDVVPVEQTDADESFCEGPSIQIQLNLNDHHSKIVDQQNFWLYLDANKLDTCASCHRHRSMVQSAHLEVSLYFWKDVQALLCERCYRHQKIFGHTWPVRYVALPPDTVPGRIPDSDMAGQVIFVDPMSKRIPIWWTAIILDPRRDVPSYVLKNAKPGEVFIRYFADGSYGTCPLKDMREFHPEKEAYKFFRKYHRRHLQADQGVQVALKYVLYRKKPSCWSR